MARKDSIKERTVEIGLLQHLLDAGAVFGAPDAGGDCYEVLGAENPALHAVKLNGLCFFYGFFGKAVGGDPLDGESSNHRMLAFGVMAELFEVRVKLRVTGGQAIGRRNEENIRIIRGEWFGVSNRGERPTQRIFHNQTRISQAVCGFENFSERYSGRRHGKLCLRVKLAAFVGERPFGWREILIHWDGSVSTSDSIMVQCKKLH